MTWRAELTAVAPIVNNATAAYVTITFTDDSTPARVDTLTIPLANPDAIRNIATEGVNQRNAIDAFLATPNTGAIDTTPATLPTITQLLTLLSPASQGKLVNNANLVAIKADLLMGKIDDVLTWAAMCKNGDLIDDAELAAIRAALTPSE